MPRDPEEDWYGGYTEDEWDERVSRFADPGGTSALHAADRDNPRDQPCPNCGTENVLTHKDVASGYQCDRCADALEGFGGYGS
jgi:ribosomal protein S27AE